MAGVFRWLPRPCSGVVRMDAPLSRAFFPFSTRRHDGKEQQQQQQIRQVQSQARESGRPPPVRALPKGKLLTTPNRLLKLTIPLPTGKNTIEPLSLFLHPQQPLSYVERLIQAELPPLVDKGRERAPSVYFWAEDTGSSGSSGGESSSGSSSRSNNKKQSDEAATTDKDWVRWGSSTEMGDFIREAARGREFVVRVEGGRDNDKNDIDIAVGVPSFADRTYYQRMRLRRLSGQLEHLAAIKHECDRLAHRSARRLAKGGFGLLAGWWVVVYWVTFCTDYGWDLVEPVTYLASLAAILGGYFWFLFVSRDVSYKAAMNMTVSRQQAALYETRGFDVRRWEQLVEEATGLRAEIRRVAYEYDVDWDEGKELGSERVKKVLEKEERRREGEEEEGEEEEEEEEEGEDEDEGCDGEKDGKKKDDKKVDGDK